LIVADKIDEMNRFLQRSPFHNWLKCKVTAFNATDGTVTITFEERPELRRSPDATASHGGVIAAFVDIAGHAALQAQTGRGQPTIDLRVDYLRPAEFPVTARATPKRIGKTIGIADVEILGRNGDASALGRAVFMTRAP
jgi:uncharacterized protein (TIGR00369 family)